MASSSSPPSAVPAYQPGNLPVAQLESLRSKINSMVESIEVLRWTIDPGGQNVMPAWPDILSKYTILLSQSHNLTSTLAGAGTTSASRANGHGGAPATNPYERLAVHLSTPVSDTQLESEVMAVMRMHNTADIADHEIETIKHLAQHMATRGSLGVLGKATGSAAAAAPRSRFGGAQEKKPEYADVLRECEQIRLEHDERVERAVRAVMLLREKFDWKARVEVENEEPEEIEWIAGEGGDADVDMNIEGAKDDKAEESNESEEEEELEEVLGNGEDRSQGGSEPGTPDHTVNDTSVPMTQG